MDGRHNRGSQTHQGVTLLEVLIALLILSFALLGLATLQTRALRLGEMADMQQRAIQLAREIGEVMRSNPTAVRRSTYAHPRGRRSASSTGVVPADLRAWLAQVAGLPDGSGEIIPCNRSSETACVDATGHIVTIFWNATRNPATDHQRCPPGAHTDMQCYRHLVPDSHAFTIR